MYITSNPQGNLVIYQSSSLKSCWGHIDNGNYITTRDDKKSQIFHLYNNTIAIQLELLEFLEKHFPKSDIRIYILNYEKENFWAVCPISKFRELSLKWQKETGKQSIFNYDKQDYSKYGKQIRLPMNSFIREYINQKKLCLNFG